MSQPSKKEDETLSKLKDEISRTSSIVKEALSDARPEDVKVAVLGFTGSGKTTLLHILAGKRVFGTKTPFGFVLDVKEKDRLRTEYGTSTIGHGVDAETYLPNRWKDRANHILSIDCPGFVDSDRLKRVINGFTIDQILESGGKIKVLLVISEVQMIERADEAFKAFDILCDMFPNLKELQKTICIVITKTTVEDPTALIDRLAESEDRDNPLVKYLASKRGKKQIFALPAVKEEGE